MMQPTETVVRNKIISPKVRLKVKIAGGREITRRSEGNSGALYIGCFGCFEIDEASYGERRWLSELVPSSVKEGRGG